MIWLLLNGFRHDGQFGTWFWLLLLFELGLYRFHIIYTRVWVIQNTEAGALLLQDKDRGILILAPDTSKNKVPTFVASAWLHFTTVI